MTSMLSRLRACLSTHDPAQPSFSIYFSLSLSVRVLSMDMYLHVHACSHVCVSVCLSLCVSAHMCVHKCTMAHAYGDWNNLQEPSTMWLRGKELGLSGLIANYPLRPWPSLYLRQSLLSEPRAH